MRHHELDIIKGVAVILMITFHIFYMMNNMGFNKIDSSSFPLSFIAKISHLTFITVSGINMFLSFKRYREKFLKSSDEEKKYIRRKFYLNKIKRSTVLLGLGMVMTFLSKKAFGDRLSVKFGILHFMGTAILLSLGIFRLSEKSFSKIRNILILIIPLFTLLSSSFISRSKTAVKICEKVPLLCFMSGIHNTSNYNLASLDHHSIFTKFPFYSAGILIGSILLNKKSVDKKDYNVQSLSLINKLLSIIGKKSLSIYMIHWFILYGIIHSLGGEPVS